jgi:hypothetical protein
MPEDFTPKTYTFSQKWGDDPFTALGHTQVPDALIGYAARLGLFPEECWLIVCILKFKHTPDNPYPSQERLAGILGQSADTVRRLLKRIQRKGLVSVERVRGDLGHYTHSVYDFTPLRHALNEAFYQDHPEDRPKGASQTPPSATMHNCTVVENSATNSPDSATTPQKVAQPPRKTDRYYPAKSDLTTVQNCGTKKSQKKEYIKEIEATLNVVGADGGTTKHEAASEAISGVQTSNVSRSDCKTLSSQETVPELPKSAALPKSAVKKPMLTLEHQRMADKIVKLTDDEKSRKRYEQLASIAVEASRKGVEAWDMAFTITHAKLRKTDEPVQAPGAYFCTLLVHFFIEAQIYVPVGTPEERKDIRTTIHHSLQG